MPYIQICRFYLFFEHRFIGLELKINGQKMGSLNHIYVSNYGSKILKDHEFSSPQSVDLYSLLIH